MQTIEKGYCPEVFVPVIRKHPFDCDVRMHVKSSRLPFRAFKRLCTFEWRSWAYGTE